MTDEERFFYELGRKAYGDRELIITVNRTSNKITFEDRNSEDVWELSGTDIEEGVRITI